jgi:TRAP-type C4-dicarboxylate transport system substrate-binding protein
MKKSAVGFAFGLLFLIAIPGMVFAQRGGGGSGVIDIRVASPLPRNSDWGRTLDRLAGEWARVTNNAVRPNIRHDGSEGGETRMLSSLASNNIQAALLTSFGLAYIVPEVMSLSIPFMIRNDAELNLVLADVLPFLDGKANSTNFVILAWSKAGWVNIFSRDQILVPSDLRGMTLATNAESADMNVVLSRMGFNLEVVEVADMGTRLASGRINALYQSPAAIAPLGLHRNLGHMLDMPIAPFMGAIVLNRVTWDRLGPENQRAMMEVTRRIAAEFDATMPATVAAAVTSMQRGGLRVNTPTPQQRELWNNEAGDVVDQLLGTTFDRSMHERISAILERARSGQ